MSQIVFFGIPAYGHTNPTIEVVRELVNRGVKVRYYSFKEFEDKLTQAGAEVVVCDEYLPPAQKGVENKIGKDFFALIEMTLDVTFKMDETISKSLKELKPDAIVADSMSTWGKLFAKKLDIPYICSNTTFAFNEHTAKLVKHGHGEMIKMMWQMGKINRMVRSLKEKGYSVNNFVDLIESNNNTDTIVYTTSEFQPMSETFSEHYAFVGPSVKEATVQRLAHPTTVYISLGTINSRKQERFYKNCIEALKNTPYKVIMAVGQAINLEVLGDIPDNFKVEKYVDQINVLVNTDVFLTHCGMNSANESMYFGVPTVLFPQQSEQSLVANRLEELGAGFSLQSSEPAKIREAVETVVNNPSYKMRAEEIGLNFRKAGGAKAAADKIMKVIEYKNK